MSWLADDLQILLGLKPHTQGSPSAGYPLAMKLANALSPCWLICNASRKHQTRNEWISLDK